MLYCSAGVTACSFLLYDTPLPLGHSNTILLPGQNFMKRPPMLPFLTTFPLCCITTHASLANYTLSHCTALALH